MHFNIAHTPPTEQAIQHARARTSRQLKRVRMRMVAFYVIGAFSFPLGVLAAMLLAGRGVSNVPGQLIFVATAAIIAIVVYFLFNNTSQAKDLEHNLENLRPVVNDCCGMEKLSTDYPLVAEYRSAVEAQKRQMVFGEYLVIKDWFESKHGKLPEHGHA
jgi:hypothetical protein